MNEPIAPEVALAEAYNSVLVIDDDPQIQSLLRFAMEQDGHPCLTTDSAETALTWLAYRTFGVVIVDLSLPGLGGLEFLAELSKLEIDTIPIVITASTDVDSVIQATRLGAINYLNKPIKLELLRRVVDLGLEMGRNRRSERAFRQLQQERAALFDASPDAILIVDAQEICVHANASSERLFSCTRNAIIGKRLGSNLGDPVAIALRKLVKLACESSMQRPQRLLPIGDETIVSVIAAPIGSESASNRRVVLILREITQEIRSQQRIQSTRDFYQSALDALTSEIAILDSTGTIIAVNAAWRDFGSEHQLSLPNHGIGSNYLTACMGTAEGREIAAGIRAVASGNQSVFIRQYPCPRPHRVDWFMIRVTRFGDTGEPFIVVAHQDVTDRVEVEQEMRVRDTHKQAILNTAVDAIITICDRGIIESYNRACQTIFGYSSDEVIGQNVSLLMDDPYRQEHDEYLRHYLKTGEKRVIGFRREVRGRRKDGSVLPLELAVSEVWLAGQRKFVGILRDISELKRVEGIRTRLLRELLTAQEDERRRVARELHDGIGQSLVSLKFGLQAISQAKTIQEIIDRASRLSQLAAEGLEEVRRMAQGLRPSVLDDLGLSAAIERLLGNFTKVHGIRSEFVAPDDAPMARLPVEVETTVYRIVQEALSNIAKHANARSVDVVLETSSRLVRAVIVDDGIGFVGTQSPQASGGLGLSGMRERAALLGGTVIVESIPEHGTTIVVEIPLSRER
ncbi:PAS domain S-box protein [Tuwongella immobilis]|uniref:Sensor protein FixL n=1 Tax=Tuwongella immobilis TaxID=692036 RepID=A0A6C2YQV3_9BACT|nr:PAS domain S-box protein [Tuwongella immobilis]VIP03539.1 histidine kinase : Histidine kinase OS=Salinibacter ruber (strain DSM 13855 / M31) GN=SRU_0678 PE=4 SV=1: Response_reg: PAS_4: PAS_4: PAS_9: HisKA_3: HATPase_c [Tuwongella immobilis]VTS04446.1 histidine kinase : Histidine kinase OS=Salinibacter ruber (strain DSM 13855 / M31) GN=SRU_0678 PE=4 SV=1: Response_reg: PAS_4: PAS_4: PAS_9: HisKA_3: HATPase_c [Tuwongella immobilis]